MSGLTQRAITGFVFVLIVTGCIYAGPISFVILIAIITGGALWEFFGLVLTKQHRRDMIRRMLALGLGIVPFFMSTIVQLDLVRNRESFIAISALLFFPLTFSVFIYELYTKSERPFVNVAFVMLGMVYIGVPFALLLFVAFDEQVYYPNIIFSLLVMNWVNDSGAYLVGSKLGKTPLFPRISPKKTWEGSAGGMALTLIFGMLLHYTFQELALQDWLVLAAIVVVFGSLGDLVESMLKRSVQIKDSGGLLPGHGGLLDRFDAFIFLLPYATAYLLWIR
ncbi:MAG: phosphatidate cytidylyltransferase [Phaeodactylibacter sp.]|uniref:phosphatidate cytidylyltransferase n=1 Tax=Phaeodactylibacter sp. TaxID=1940289 RepID=UPI0032ED0E64